MVTTQQIENFRVSLEQVNAEYYTRTMANFPDYFGGITVEMARKNAKFVIVSGGQRSVLLFVELETGNILKAASWSAPAKGSRGNIATTKPNHGMQWLYR